jgi:hypothetical protein
MELIIVCILAALFLTISLPTLRNNLLTDELDTAARKIIGTVQELRNLAVREHKAYLLHFDIGENRLWYELDGTRNVFNDEPKTGFQLPESIRLDDVQPHSQKKEDRGSVTLWISKRGYMDQTVVHISDQNGKVISLFFSPFSGSARVYNEYLEVE